MASQTKIMTCFFTCLILALAFPVSPASAGVCKYPGFKVLNAMKSITVPALSEYGLVWVRVIYEQEFRRPGETETFVDEQWILDTIIPKISKREKIIILDIESWDRIEEIDKYITIIQIMKRALPGRKIGFYANPPHSDYWSPVSGNEDRIAEWQARNDLLRPLADVSDIIFPSIYTFYDDRDGWVIYAEANINEALVYGKPVYPFIWPMYHPMGYPSSGISIDGDFWRVQLETIVGSGVHGVVIWGGISEDWDDNADWWLATQDFLCEGKK